MHQRAFSVVELIGVLAIIAILTTLLLPRLSRAPSKPDTIQAVDEAKLVEAVIAVQTLQVAVNTHLAQFGSLASLNGAPLPFSRTYDHFAQILLTEGLIERPFELRLGTNAFLRLVGVSDLSMESSVNGLNGAYDLDGDGRNDVVGASFIVEVVIPKVTGPEASALNDRLDGPRLAATKGGEDLSGRVVYRAAGPNGKTEVHIYLLQK